MSGSGSSCPSQTEIRRGEWAREERREEREAYVFAGGAGAATVISCGVAMLGTRAFGGMGAQLAQGGGGDGRRGSRSGGVDVEVTGLGR